MTKVVLHLYDLSQGMARAMSMGIIGKQLDGIWHSGIAVFGIEYFYGGGICAAPAGRAIPHLSYQEISLGDTSKSQIELETFLQSISHRFTQATYSLLRHNCNNFANEVAIFLTGKGIPEHIIRLPQEFLTSPMGATIAPMIEGMEQRMRNELVGDGRGLNPFAHIQGRTLLFPPSPAVADSSSTTKPLKDEESVPPVWLEGDVSLLKTAVDGIPASIMSPEQKAKVVAIDKTVVDELGAILRNEFKNKTPILLTFATITRFFWKIPEFRATINIEFLQSLVQSCLQSDNVHVVSAGFAACVNVSAAMSDEVGALFLSSLGPRIFEKYPSAASSKKLLPMFALNMLGNIKFSEETSTEYVTLFRNVLKVGKQFTLFEDKSLVPKLMKSIDNAAGLILSKSAERALGGEVEVEEIINMVEAVDRDYQVEMPHLIRLVVE